MKTRLLFVVGVPRSGTTLLRVLLGSHSQIASSPETPWITGPYGHMSVRSLVNSLNEDLTGPAKNMPGVGREHIILGARHLIETILAGYQPAQNKKWLTLKTPDDIANVGFLGELFPAAHIIHIVRDGRDVACSSLSKSTEGWGGKLNGGYGQLTLENAIRRWADWETQAANELSKVCSCRVNSIRYEDIVSEPGLSLKKLLSALSLDYEAEMLCYWKHSHVFPSWEAGSNDVAVRRAISDASVGRWRREINEEQASAIWDRYSKVLKSRGYPER